MITNVTKKFVITSKKKECKSLLSKVIGLMLAPKLKDKGLVFYFDTEQYNPIHMYFVFQKIDILYLDAGKRVVEIARNVKPFTTYNPKNKSMYFIEVPTKTVRDTVIGDRIEF
jgi:uncharacterized membrane protein (UPF0127 family)